ncbi:hypothetical protein OAT89_00775 [bacterium]|jgi:hypothetical protein|nr:hypothetical protein [bacterium]
MKHLLTAIACCFAVAGSAQTDAYPYNPDSNGDGLIGVADLLTMLSEFGTEAQLQTCFKGDICWFDPWPNPVNGTSYTEAGCGTLIAETASGGSAYVQYVNITNDGYNEGDVLHLIHASGSYATNGTAAVFRTAIGDNWTNVIVLGAGDNLFKTSARLIFNGEYWEELD